MGWSEKLLLRIVPSNRPWGYVQCTQRKWLQGGGWGIYILGGHTKPLGGPVHIIDVPPNKYSWRISVLMDPTNIRYRSPSLGGAKMLQNVHWKKCMFQPPIAYQKIGINKYTKDHYAHLWVVNFTCSNLWLVCNVKHQSCSWAGRVTSSNSKTKLAWFP